MVAFIAEIFTDVLLGGYDPECWKETRLKVLYKKGDPQVLDNHRPISILAILYKLFSRVLQERVKTTLDRGQSVDQAAFRRGFSYFCLDANG